MLECLCLDKYNDEAIFYCCDCTEEEYEQKRVECERDWNGWWDCYIVSSCEEWEDLDDEFEALIDEDYLA